MAGPITGDGNPVQFPGMTLEVIKGSFYSDPNYTLKPGYDSVMPGLPEQQFS